MITATLIDKQINIPTSWHDVPFKNYIKFLDCEDSISQAETLLELEKGTLSKINSQGLSAILMAMSFMSEPPEAYNSELSKINIAKESYGKLEMAKSILMRVEKPYMALIDIVKIYMDIDYSDRPTSVAYPLAVFFLNNCTDFLKSTSD
jgi:hypothetical protein